MTPENTAEAKARESLKHLKRALRMAAKHPAKEKSIHDLRVTIRRFRQVLRVYAASFDRIRKMRRALRRLMDLCAEARNCDVAIQVLEEAGAPAKGPVKLALRKRRASATKKLARELKQWHVGAHIRRWHEWLSVKKDEEAPLATTPVPELTGDFLTAGAAAADAKAAYRQMHKFRLLVKKTRYTAEVLAAPKTRIETLRALQDHLGAINDCVTTADLLAEVKASAAERRKMKAALNLLAAKRSGEFRQYWRAHFGRKGRIETTRSETTQGRAR